MLNNTFDIEAARDEVNAHATAGAPFLIAYGTTFLITAVFSRFISLEIAGLIVIFQGMVALPIAFWLERRMSKARMSADNPLRTLSAYLAVSQAAALPALIIVYNVKPLLLPLLLAAFGGMHFVPYAWLHRTRIYLFLGGLLALGSFYLLLQFETKSFTLILAYIGLLYCLAALFVYCQRK